MGHQKPKFDLTSSNSPRDLKLGSHNAFWTAQRRVISSCQRRRNLGVFVAHVHPASPQSIMRSFTADLRKQGWLITVLRASYPDFGDSVDDCAVILLGIHSATARGAERLVVPMPPRTDPPRMSTHLLDEYNQPCYAVSYARDEQAFVLDENQLRADRPLHVGQWHLKSPIYLQKTAM